MSVPAFTPNPPDAAGIVSWAHFGDLHIELADGQNYKDLVELVHKLNARFAKTISFAMLPANTRSFSCTAIRLS